MNTYLNTSTQSEDQHLSDMSTGQAVRLLTSQIPSFSGTEEEDVELWIRKVEFIADTHGVSDKVIRLAASQKLANDAKDWHDMNIGPATSSWASLKPALIKAFRRKIPIHFAMQKVDARKWNFLKESFQQYARQKLKLMHPLQLPERDCIQLLINGISSASLRGTAAALRAQTIDDFLDLMYDITSSYATMSKRMSPPPVKKERGKVSPSSPTKSNQTSKDAKDLHCGYCKARGHSKEDCFKLKRREQATASVTAPASSKSSLSSANFKVASSQVGCVAEDPVTSTVPAASSPKEPETVGCVETNLQHGRAVSDTL